MPSDLYCSRYRLLSGSSRLLWVGFVFVFVVVFLITNLLNAMFLMVRIVAQAPKLRARCFFMLRPGSFSSRLHGRRNLVVRAHLFSPPTFGLPCLLYVVIGLLYLCRILCQPLPSSTFIVAPVLQLCVDGLLVHNGQSIYARKLRIYTSAILISWFHCVLHVFDFMAYCLLDFVVDDV